MNVATPTTPRAAAERTIAKAMLALLIKSSPVIAILMVAVLTLTAVNGGRTAPSDIALEDIPHAALEAYMAAADECDGLTWNVLAGIGKVESNHGRVFGGTINPDTGDIEPRIFGAALNGSGAGGNTTPWPAGQWEGQWGLTGQWLRALGPMQFISPSWAAHGQDGNGDGVANPHNIYDATRGAARLLCSSQNGSIADIRDALFSYNRSTEYGDLVLHWAQLYVALPGGLAGGTAADLLNHPNIELSPRARADVEAGIIDPRLIGSLVSVAEDFQMYVGWLKTGHSMCVGGGDTRTRPNCNISNHFFGRAADVGAVGFVDGPRLAVTPNNDAARALATRLGALPPTDPLRPESVGSPWDTGVFQGHFTDGSHLDHLHIAWRSDPPPPETINTTRDGVPDSPTLIFTAPPAGDWFTPVILPARTTIIQATPGDVQRLISDADADTRIELAAGFYGPLNISDTTGLSLVGPESGIATFSSGDITSGAGITIERSSDISISGVTVTDSLWGIQVRNSNDVGVAGNVVTELGQEGIHARDNSTNITIANNLISHTGLRPGIDPEQQLPYRTFGEGIYIGTGRGGLDTTNNVTITGNEIHHTSAEAIDLKPGTHTITVTRNIIHDIATQTSGAIVIHIGDAPTNTDDISITGNIIWNINATSQFRDGNAIVASGPAEIRANIIFDTAHRGVLIRDVYGPQRNVNVARNIIFDNGIDDVFIDTHTPPLHTANVTDTLDRTLLDTNAFAGGWINNNRPTKALTQLVELLENPAIPVDQIDSILNPPPPLALTNPWGGINNRGPSDWPIRNTNLDNRLQFINTPAAQLDWQQFTEPSDRAIRLGPTTPTKILGQFRTQCSFSHFAYDDPLVHPGEPGAAHLHMFFGNNLADAHSSYESLRDTGSSTCNGLEGNRSGYWIPAVFDAGGNARVPSRIEVYYKTHSNQASNAIQPPPGTGMVAGTAATNREIEWACQETGAQGANLNRPIQQRQNTIPRCSPTATLLAHIKFPQCLRNPESVNPQGQDVTNQLAYPGGGFFFGNCPTGTRYMTAIEYFIAWSPNNHDGQTDQWWISSDVNHMTGQLAPNGSTLHGDWFGAWHPGLMDEIFQNCIGRIAECSWDLVQSKQRLIQVEHFGGRHPVAYNGPRSIPAQQLSELLCPGDNYTTPTDAAMCMSQEIGYGIELPGIALLPTGGSTGCEANCERFDQ